MGGGGLADARSGALQQDVSGLLSFARERWSQRFPAADTVGLAVELNGVTSAATTHDETCRLHAGNSRERFLQCVPRFKVEGRNVALGSWLFNVDDLCSD